MRPLDVARDCIKRGWNPVPIPFLKKGPISPGWQERRISKDNVAAHFNVERLNVGAQLGAASGGLTDIDLDCSEAVAIGSYLLPKTNCIFGRLSKRNSHYFYRTKLCETESCAAIQFKDPTPIGKNEDNKEAHKQMLLEVRIGGGNKGAQTVIPGSVHETYETYEFEPECDGEPASVDGAELMTAAKQIAVASLFSRYWPPSGWRHDARLAIAGLLILADIDESWAKLFVEAVARAAGDPDIDDARSAVKSTFSKAAGGGPVTGLPAAREVFGVAVANKAAEWLGCRARLDDERAGIGIAPIAPGNETESTLAHLATLSVVEYERARMSEAKRLGIRVVKLDAEVNRRRPVDVQDDLSGRPLSLPVPEPWPSQVDGAELLSAIERAILDHVKLPDHAAVAVALWCIHAHALSAFFYSARLAITSPEKRCGKSTLLRLVEALTPKPLQASNITPAAIFRTVEKYQPTLLIDEADTFLVENDELRGIINSGHAKDGQVVRLVGDDYEPRTFSTFCPTAIAAIGAIPGTIEDRSISVALRRKRNDETVLRFRRDRRTHANELNRKAARWSADNLDALRDADPATPQELHDRAADNWGPLLSIADLAGGEWPARARRTALELSGVSASEAEAELTMLLEDIRSVFQSAAADRLKSEDLTMKLWAMHDRPWRTIDGGKTISPATMARLLRPYGIKPQTIRIREEETTAKGYYRADFDDAFSRYLPTRPDTP